MSASCSRMSLSSIVSSKSRICRSWRASPAFSHRAYTTSDQWPSRVHSSKTAVPCYRRSSSWRLLSSSSPRHYRLAPHNTSRRVFSHLPTSRNYISQTAQLSSTIISTAASQHSFPSLRSSKKNSSSVAYSSRLRRPSATTSRTHPQLPYSSVRHCSHRTAMCWKDGPAPSTSVPADREVLPTNVKPIHYDLRLEPDLEKFTYTGHVGIDLDVVEDSTSISLNTLQIDIKSATILAASEVHSKTPKIAYDSSKQIQSFAFDQPLKAGTKARLEIEFAGTLNDDLAGFYRSSYIDKDGNKKYMATTQMEAIDARRAFPCFDEPALKASFTITLVAGEHLTFLSNMDVKSTESAGTGKKAVTFNKTPIMSTYLVAFIVGELNYIESNEFRIPVRVYAPPDQNMDQAKFSLDLAAKTLKFYEEKFDSPFPLPKMDMVAIPDFSAGAMENWGLVTYRVVDILIDEKNASVGNKMRIAETVQHELAHQWFGNLVTMDFWEGLWLNEGFATWMSWYAVNSFFPEWKVWQSYLTDTLSGALSLDSLRSSHPIEVPVQRADQVGQIFDAISYMKGSCVIRMVARFLGEETFLEGIRQYLKKHAYGNTQTNDLWNALSKASGKDVASVMGIWTRYIGFPVITVTEDEANSSIHLKQNRFLRTGDTKPEEDKTLYPVFLGLRHSNGIDEDSVLREREGTFKVPDLDFFKLNADHTGFYRTFYTPSRLHKLGQAAKAGKLGTEDRAGMVSDAGALSASGHQPSSGTLAMVSSLGEEPDYIVWSEMLAFIGSLRAAFAFEPQPAKDALKAFVLQLSSGKAHSLGWDIKSDEDSIQQQFKALLFSNAGASGDKAIITAATEMFDKYVAGDDEAVNPNLRAAVFSIVLQYRGTEKDWEAVLNKYKTGKVMSERLTALRTLGRAEDPKLIQRTLNLILSDDVRLQDVYLPMGGLRAHKGGIEALWQWFQTNYDALIKVVPPSGHMLQSITQIVVSNLTQKSQIDSVHAFFKNRSTVGFDQSLAQAIDSATAKMQWVNRDRDDVKGWLKSNGNSSQL